MINAIKNSDKTINPVVNGRVQLQDMQEKLMESFKLIGNTDSKFSISVSNIELQDQYLSEMTGKLVNSKNQIEEMGEALRTLLDIGNSLSEVTSEMNEGAQEINTSITTLFTTVRDI